MTANSHFVCPPIIPPTGAVKILEAALRDARAFVNTALVDDTNPTMSKRMLIQRIEEALSALHPLAQPAAPAVGGERDAMIDALAGWRYIRMVHGDLYGVGWDRVEQKLVAALAAPAVGGEQFHPGKCLPDCMMPDGGECCPGYVALYDAYWHLVRAAQPASPLRGRDYDRIALDAAHQIEALPSDLHEAQKTARIQLIVLDAISSAPPEQPAADPATGRDELIEQCALIAEGFDAACDSPRMKLFVDAGLVTTIYKRDGEIGAAIRALSDKEAT